MLTIIVQQTITVRDFRGTSESSGADVNYLTSTKMKICYCVRNIVICEDMKQKVIIRDGDLVPNEILNLSSCEVLISSSVQRLTPACK